jgi:hypothetical protein
MVTVTGANGQSRSIVPSKRVEVRERGAALDGDAACAGIDAGGLHLREVDHDTVIAHGIAGNVVSTATNGEQQPVVPREIHRANNV